MYLKPVDRITVDSEKKIMDLMDHFIHPEEESNTIRELKVYKLIMQSGSII